VLDRPGAGDEGPIGPETGTDTGPQMPDDDLHHGLSDGTDTDMLLIDFR
jgi:hypothetical protein